MAIARFGGDALRAHYAERSLLRVGGMVAAAAMAMVWLSCSPVASFIGYSGFRVGPPLIGGIAHGTSLTRALCVVVASAFRAWGARYVPRQE